MDQNNLKYEKLKKTHNNNDNKKIGIFITILLILVVVLSTTIIVINITSKDDKKVFEGNKEQEPKKDNATGVLELNNDIKNKLKLKIDRLDSLDYYDNKMDFSTIDDKKLITIVYEICDKDYDDDYCFTYSGLNEISQIYFNRELPEGDIYLNFNTELGSKEEIPYAKYNSETKTYEEDEEYPVTSKYILNTKTKPYLYRAELNQYQVIIYKAYSDFDAFLNGNNYYGYMNDAINNNIENKIFDVEYNEDDEDITEYDEIMEKIRVESLTKVIYSFDKDYHLISYSKSGETVVFK